MKMFFDTSYRDDLVGIRHHGNEHVQQHDDVYHGVRAEHEESPESGEALYPSQIERHQIYHAEAGPEKRL